MNLVSKPIRRDVRALVDMAAGIMAAALLREQEVKVEAVRPPARKRRQDSASIDFHAVAEHHRDIDKRLRNWGDWCNSRAAASSAPMFRMAMPAERARREEYGRLTVQSVDRNDATRIASAVGLLPAPHAHALHWAYVKPVSPWKACQTINTTMEGLALLLRDGRQMLINRGV